MAKWDEYHEKFCGCKDASMKNSCKGLPNCYLHSNHPERKTPPTVEYRCRARVGVPGCVWFVLLTQSFVLIALALHNLGVL